LVAVLEGAEGIDESQYFVGKKTILGIFPAPGNQAYAFYMIPADSLSAIKAEGVETLQKKWTAVYPDMAHSFETLVDWNKTTYLGTGRVRTQTWVCHGAVLIGDAAHGMNPHASQGRMQAMVDAVMLAEVVESCMGKDDWSVSALKPFEMRRRPQVTMLQQLADEEVFFWNTGNPLLSFLRDRVFSTLDGNARLQYQVLTAKAGMREAPPFNWVVRFQAAGLIPDPRAHRFSPPHLPSWT
jgi:2-polyprenyl-6-methoxyphenol hydroxylase-like FAD-dependent oxidoreductase